MSMPVITANDNPVSSQQAVANLLESIALEETALSHILNAEGEKLQKVLAMECANIDDILAVNESVRNTVAEVHELEATLRDKLEFISNNLYCPCSEGGGCECDCGCCCNGNCSCCDDDDGNGHNGGDCDDDNDDQSGSCGCQKQNSCGCNRLY